MQDKMTMYSLQEARQAMLMMAAQELFKGHPADLTLPCFQFPPFTQIGGKKPVFSPREAEHS